MGTIPPIKVERNLVRLAKAYLGTDECFVWVGFGFDTPDNDNERVAKTRLLMAMHYPNIPYGMFVGNPSSSGKLLEPLFDEDADGYYELRLDLWPAGIYRFNYHGPDGKSSPHGGPLAPVRDGNVSWAWWGADRVDPAVIESVRDFVHKESNGVGFCFRVLIDRDRTVKPFGNLDLIKE